MSENDDQSPATDADAGTADAATLQIGDVDKSVTVRVDQSRPSVQMGDNKGNSCFELMESFATHTEQLTEVPEGFQLVATLNMDNSLPVAGMFSLELFVEPEAPKEAFLLNLWAVVERARGERVKSAPLVMLGAYLECLRRFWGCDRVVTVCAGVYMHRETPFKLIRSQDDEDEGGGAAAADEEAQVSRSPGAVEEE